MSDIRTPVYFRRREQQARELAERATLPAIKKLHSDMASEYVRLAEEAELLAARPTLRLVRSAR